VERNAVEKLFVNNNITAIIKRDTDILDCAFILIFVAAERFEGKLEVVV
jgi:hypothetical protein